ncbi:MAG TPA: extracellular solute-binding protein [Terriglobia bacterium]|nr:extracellular solute-binding protein [Terriglobia bacterium]
MALAGAVAAVQSLPGCGRSRSPLQRGRITFGSFADPALDVLKEVLLPEFEKATGIPTEWVEADFSGWLQKALSDGQTKAGSFDIYVLDDLWVPRFAGAGYLANLDEMGFHTDQDFVPTALDLGYWPPKVGLRQPGLDPKAKPALFSLPLISDLQLLFYRNDIYSSGPPASWDEVLEMARQKSDPSKRQYGWVSRGVKGNPVVNSYFVLLHDFGGKIFGEDWKVVFNSPQAIESLEFYLNLLSYAPEGVAEFDSDQEGETLLQGNAFAATMWTGWCGQTDDPTKSRVVGKIDFAVPPKKINQIAKLGLFMAGIAASAPNKAEALEFLRWFSSSPTQLKFARAGGTPFKISAFNDAEARKKSRWLDAIFKALLLGVPSPRTSDWSKIEDILGTELNKALIERGGAKEHLDAAAAEATAFLKSAGYPAG